MKEGAWINANTGHYRLVDDHARWIRRPGNAEDLGLPEEVLEALRRIPWDLSPFAERTIVLFKAMEAGFIRARAHGSYTTFEHFIPWKQAIQGAQAFMRDCFGPRMTARFNDLGTGGTVEFLYGHFADRLGEPGLTFLLPPWKRPRVLPPVPRPYLVAEVPDEGWLCWRLPQDLSNRALVDLIRGHVPDNGGWLALVNGLTWRVSPTTPPLRRVDGEEQVQRFEVCPDCGWPRVGSLAPCQCLKRPPCGVCSMPILWPIPLREHVGLDGRVVHVPHFAGYAHRCVPWAQVGVHGLQDLLERLWTPAAPRQ